MLSVKIFFQIMVVWQIFFWCLEKNSITKNNNINIAPPPSLHTHTPQIKTQHVKLSIPGPQGKGTQIFYKTIKSCVIVDFIVED